MKSLKLNNIVLRAAISLSDESIFFHKKIEYKINPIFQNYNIYLISKEKDTYIYFYNNSDFDFSSGSKNIEIPLLDPDKFLYLDDKQVLQ
jgi:hypothetical protein